MEEFQRPIEKVQEYILNFSLGSCKWGSQGYKRVLLQLFGYMGHGKSSLINSCFYALKNGPYLQHALAIDLHGGVTTHRTTYPLTSNITIVDNRGCLTLNSSESAEIYAQLGNFSPLDKRVEWKNGYVEMIEKIMETDMDPNLTDLIVPVFVYSTQKTFAEPEKEEVKTFLNNCKTMTGLVPIIVLTHKTSGDFYELEKTFRLMGAEQVMKVENYTQTDHQRTRGRDTEILKFLYNVLEDVTYRMNHEIRNPNRERVDRKKFLLKLLHEKPLKRKREEDDDDELGQPLTSKKLNSMLRNIVY